MLFLQLPDGNGQFHQLSGTAETPKPITLPTREIPAKTTHIEKIEIENWLKKQQRFRVDIEVIKPEKVDSTFTLKGNDYFDIRSNEIRNYELEVNAYKEGVYSVKITLRNSKTEEFLTYILNIKITQGRSLNL